jgi:hypothetical protein
MAHHEAHHITDVRDSRRRRVTWPSGHRLGSRGALIARLVPRDALSSAVRTFPPPFGRETSRRELISERQEFVGLPGRGEDRRPCTETPSRRTGASLPLSSRGGRRHVARPESRVADPRVTAGDGREVGIAQFEGHGAGEGPALEMEAYDAHPVHFEANRPGSPGPSRRSLAADRLAPRLGRPSGRSPKERAPSAQLTASAAPGGAVRMSTSRWIPAARSLAAVLGPTPHSASTGSPWRNPSMRSGEMTVRPSGFFQPEAILARNLLGATPAEAVSFSSRMRCLRCPPRRRRGRARAVLGDVQVGPSSERPDERVTLRKTEDLLETAGTLEVRAQIVSLGTAERPARSGSRSGHRTCGPVVAAATTPRFRASCRQHRPPARVGSPVAQRTHRRRPVQMEDLHGVRSGLAFGEREA